MPSVKTQFSVGLFVLIGFAIAAAAILWLGMSHYFEKGRFYVAYFDESVQGLDMDSPVKYRGVAIGRVVSISVAPDATLIQVIMKIESGLKDRKHLVAQLKSVGITGIMYIELDRKGKNEPDLSPKVRFPSKYPVVGTKPSGIKRFFEGIADLFQQIKGLDIQGISDNFQTVLNTVNQAVEDAQIDALSSEMRAALQRIEKILEYERWHRVLNALEAAGTSIQGFALNADQTVTSADAVVSNLDEALQDIEKELKTAVAGFKSAMQHADRFMASGAALVDHADRRFSLVQTHLIDTLKSLELAGDNLGQFLERLSDQPSLLIFGKEPAGREMESKD